MKSRLYTANRAYSNGSSCRATLMAIILAARTVAKTTFVYVAYDLPFEIASNYGIHLVETRKFTKNGMCTMNQG